MLGRNKFERIKRLIEMWNSIFPNLLIDEGEQLIKTSEAAVWPSDSDGPIRSYFFKRQHWRNCSVNGRRRQTVHSVGSQIESLNCMSFEPSKCNCFGQLIVAKLYLATLMWHVCLFPLTRTVVAVDIVPKHEYKWIHVRVHNQTVTFKGCFKLGGWNYWINNIDSNQLNSIDFRLASFKLKILILMSFLWKLFSLFEMKSNNDRTLTCHIWAYLGSAQWDIHANKFA